MLRWGDLCTDREGLLDKRVGEQKALATLELAGKSLQAEATGSAKASAGETDLNTVDEAMRSWR